MVISLRRGLGALLVAWALLLPAASLAQTVGAPSDGGFVTLDIDDSAPRAGTTVLAPNTSLSEFSLSLLATTSALTVQPKVYPVVSGVIAANPIWTGPAVTVTSNSFAAYTFSPGIAVTAGATYALVVEKTVAGETGQIEWLLSDAYADGVPVYYSSVSSTWTDNPSVDAVFSATFVSAAPTVPTLSEWALIVLGVALAGSAALYVQRRRSAI
jgi:hypothetical protein